MLVFLQDLLSEFSDVDYGEIRFHDRTLNQIQVRMGELEDLRSDHYIGAGVRVLHKGAWGFSSTGRTGREDIRKAIGDAIRAAEATASFTRGDGLKLGEARMAVGSFSHDINDPVTNHTMAEKMDLALKSEESIRASSDKIVSGMCVYREYLDHKFIVNTDGAKAEVTLNIPEFRLVAVAGEGDDLVTAIEGTGIAGGWKDLFGERPAEALVQSAVERAVRLTKASYPPGGRTTVILDPGLVGLISHEAIGHTVEADLAATSVTKDKIGKQVASELVTLGDSGVPKYSGYPAGILPVDDEGVLTEDTILIENGIMKSFLHDRQTAGASGLRSTGNARAFEYSDQPLIRMRNTYIAPGDQELEAIIEDTKDGYLLSMPALGGQADSNAEFMFSVQEAKKIENGKIVETFKGTTVSGQAFDVLRSVDAVSKDFRWAIGTGHCGKFQYAKVDGGGPYVRCQAIMGGVQK
jgi:TldD protein